jgi:hypothetical protein
MSSEKRRDDTAMFHRYMRLPTRSMPWFHTEMPDMFWRQAARGALTVMPAYSRKMPKCRNQWRYSHRAVRAGSTSSVSRKYEKRKPQRQYRMPMAVVSWIRLDAHRRAPGRTARR